jgi:starch phosphorylase
MGVNLGTFLALGREDGAASDDFNMTALGLRLSEQRNGVSALHGVVARRMWHKMWPQCDEDDVPIIQITNGVHVPTWVAREMGKLFDEYLGPDWVEKQDIPSLWEPVMDVPDEELWGVRQVLKRKLLYAISERVLRGWAEGRLALEQLPAMGALLQGGLTIGFVRRFAEYKRPSLLFEDAERLRRLVTDPRQPVQVIFAGKSHPADFPSKDLLHEVYSAANDRRFEGRIVFLEDYDLHLALYLVQGVDVWLNTPRRFKEACGTSGMKAAVNGVLHLSVLDGWWREGYNGSNGWAIGDCAGSPSNEEEDKADAETLYRLLEDEVVPLYYETDFRGVPHGWIQMVKETIRSIAPRFCARRMMKEYAARMYMPAARSLGQEVAD